jgi:hypothetical protein
MKAAIEILEIEKRSHKLYIENHKKYNHYNLRAIIKALKEIEAALELLYKNQVK